MNDTSASPAEKVLVWDLPVRLFHWLMVLCFAGAYLTSESEHWRLAHVTFGYTMAGLVALRLIWGVIGTRHARFAAFVRGPAAVWRYLRSLMSGQPEHHLGHNPAGAVAIVLILGLTAAVTSTGWANFNELGGEWLEEAHEVLANLMLIIIGVHVVGVVLSSRLHKENMVRAMITGYKTGLRADGIRRTWVSVAAVMLIAVLAFWWQQWQQWQQAPAPLNPATAQSLAVGHHGDDDDD
jgi:cytochrome b